MAPKTRKNKSLAAVGYVRVSTDHQVSGGLSLDAQRDAIRSWAATRGYELLEVFADEGISGGRADNRPALQAALTLACAHGAAFVTYSLSRVARSVADTINISGRLEKCGADLVSLSENLDTTSASGRMLFNILAVLAQFERDLASERSSAVLRWKRAQGQKTGGHVPFGHDLADDGVNLRKNADEQRIVARIIRMRKRGASYHGIAAKLNADGVATKTGAKWHGKVIMTLCKRDQPSAA